MSFCFMIKKKKLLPWPQVNFNDTLKAFDDFKRSKKGYEVMCFDMYTYSKLLKVYANLYGLHKTF